MICNDFIMFYELIHVFNDFYMVFYHMKLIFKLFVEFSSVLAKSESTDWSKLYKAAYKLYDGLKKEFL